MSVKLFYLAFLLAMNVNIDEAIAFTL